MNSYVKYHGGLKVNNLKLDTNIVNSLTEAKALLKSRTASTVLYNDFADGNIDAFYFTPHSIFDSNICSVYKKESSKLYYDFVCSLKGEIGFKDYNIKNNENYDYLSIIMQGNVPFFNKIENKWVTRESDKEYQTAEEQKINEQIEAANNVANNTVSNDSPLPF